MTISSLTPAERRLVFDAMRVYQYELNRIRVAIRETKSGAGGIMQPEVAKIEQEIKKFIAFNFPVSSSQEENNDD